MFLKKILSSMAIASSILGLGACKKQQLVIIKYTQPANCFVFDPNPGGTPHTTTSAGNGMFMIYKISSIQNTDPDAVDFNFKLSKIFASNPNEVPGTIPIMPTAQTAPDTKLVPKGTTANNLGRFIINVAGDPNQMKTATELLKYNSSSGESVLMVNTDAKPNEVPKAKFLDPCTSNNLP
jgi:hypothetical protein